jgi:hypothetical protein
MPKGGARLNPGPAPDPNALRRDRKDDGAWTTLPATGREGDPPVWPLLAQSDREADLWATFWAKPQAVLWERQGQVYEVAMHVRTFAEAESPGCPVNLRTLVRQQADALLLTIPAMLSARVRIATDQVAERRETKPAVARSSARERLKVANGGGA